MGFEIELEQEHAYVLLALLAIPFHCMIQGFLVAGVRYRVFSAKYISEHLGDVNAELKKAGREEIKKGCHPDNGLGRLSNALSAADWIDLQQAQRAHLNYLETLSLSLWLLAIAGVFYPFYAAVSGGVHLLGRQLYCTGFRSKPSARGPGFLLFTLSNLANFGMGVYGVAKVVGWL
mmetsp:Transcript_17600/g.27540  ORF Transcript_17600/g.27540 Transcript_17600/m.27540 type:complete len:176 (-) Transcript_17600:50-577(-)